MSIYIEKSIEIITDYDYSYLVKLGPDADDAVEISYSEHDPVHGKVVYSKSLTVDKESLPHLIEALKGFL